MNIERIEFRNGREEWLSGRLDEPENRRPRAWAIFTHCFTCSRNLKVVRFISRRLVDRGFGVLSFDFTGLGESEGDFGASGLSGDVADLVAAAGWLEEHRGGPSLLVGHSFGGASALAAAERIDSVRAVAAIAAPADPEHITNLFQDSIEEIERKGRARVTIEGRGFEIRDSMLEDLRADVMDRVLRRLSRPVLLMHSPVDRVVDVENARRLFDAVNHPKSFVSLDDADHLLLDPSDARYAADVLAAWASRYLPHRAGGDGGKEAEGDPEYPVAAVVDDSGFTTSLNASGHTLVADEPRSAGGEDRGPNPYDYLLASLGACTAMTLRMYADHKNWPLTGAEVRLRHNRIHAEDCENCETASGMLSRIVRRITLRGELSRDQRRRLIEIAEKCPVHRSLTGEIRIETEAG